VALSVAAKALPEEVQRRCNLRTDWFDALSFDQRVLDERIENAITEQSALIQRKVGEGAYDDPDTEPRHTNIKTAETYRAAAQVIEEMITTIAGAPTVVIEPDADITGLEAQVERYREQADEFLNPYLTSDDETGRKVLFAISSTGIDERLRDDFSERDFGQLEDEI
jgi:hypothetical protein